MALSANRDTPARDGDLLDFPVNAGATIHRGGLTCLNASGNAVPGSTATTLRAVGRAETSTADNPARVRIRRGVFRFNNSSAGDAITNANYGSQCFIVDDEQVALTNGGSTRSVAGIIRGVDATGVWVEF
jgi:hypothetical protein